MKRVIVYTDGACSGNPGPGGWAAVLRYGEHERILSGSESHTTNNRMEMRAAIEALGAMKEPVHAVIHTDSAYLARAFTEGWVTRWQRNGWKNSKKKPVENKDLWELLVELDRRHRVEWVKVKGHADDAMNNRVDELAVAAMNAGIADRV
ncbi:MAG: ribonuclease HI [Rhodothermia bacterium]|nr:ribonuclease HI [Rhodothermia bacterium]